MICKCHHEEALHVHQKDCTYCDPATGKFCRCELFRPLEENQTQEEGDSMATKKVARVKKTAKSEGRKPRLAPFVDEQFDIFIKLDGKEYKASVHADGMIAYEGKEYFSPSAAAMAINGDKKRMIDGWHFFTFNKNGKRVPLDTLRGEKSPLKCVDAPKPKAPKAAKKAKAPKAPKAAKAKRVRKPRAVKPVATTGPDDAPAPAVAQGEGEAAD